jgi:hypothetical protein
VESPLYSLRFSEENWLSIVDALHFRAFDLLKAANDVDELEIYGSVLYNEHKHIAALADTISALLPE